MNSCTVLTTHLCNRWIHLITPFQLNVELWPMTSHCECCARAKARVRKWQRRALPVALVVCCWHRSSSKAPRLESTTTSEPVRWKWKEKKVGLSSVMSESETSTFQGFFGLIMTFYVYLSYWKISAIMIIMWVRSSRRWIELLYFVVLSRCTS